MKLWDSLTACLLVLSAASAAGPLLGGRERPAPPGAAAGRSAERPPELHARPPASSRAGAEDRAAPAGGGTYRMDGPLPQHFEDLVDLIRATFSRISGSSSPAPSLPGSSSSSSFSSSSTSPAADLRLNPRTRLRRERKKTRSGPGRGRTGRGGAPAKEPRRRGRGGGCVLKQIHLNVTDLGLGYASGEEMIFRYCSGPCRKAETNYDKILYGLIHKRKLPAKDTPPHACCRPIAFDDDLSFLDDNLVYHTVRRHSARKCGCV